MKIRSHATRLSVLFVVASLFAAAYVAGCGGSGGASPVVTDDDGGSDASGDVGTVDGTMKAVCGDGVVEPPEECDQGSANGSGKGCQSDCTWTCVATDPKRDCATDNACTGTQTCSSMHTCVGGTSLDAGAMCAPMKYCVKGNCSAPACGDGVVEPGEECDDGNSTNGDGCDDDCKFSCVSTDPTRDCKSTNACVGMGTCNDTTHVCKAGTPAMNGTACGSNLICDMGTCGPITCGDGIVSTGEQCDFGAGNNVHGSGCEPNCQFSCTTTPNSCDDMNPCNGVETCNAVTGPDGDMGQKCNPGTPEMNGTSCGTNLTCQNGVCTSPNCGNGVIDAGEQCDLGANNGMGLGCNAQCQFDCQTSANCTGGSVCTGTPTCVPATVMGQNVQKCQAGTDATKCTMCTNGFCDGTGDCNASTCGDGCVDPSRGEQCDPPNGTTCDSMCHLIAVCGNGTIEGTEQCDDGNTRDLDGCDSHCNYEAVTRMTTVTLSGSAAPSFCTPATNRLGTQALTSTAINQLNSTLATDVNDATTNVMTQFIGLSDLTGVASSSPFSIGVMSAILDPAKGAWTGTSATNQPIDWWFLAAASTVSNGLPTGVLTNANVAARQLTAGPSDVSLSLILGGSPAQLEMLSAQIAATIDGTPAPDVPAPPPSALASGLTVFQQITGSGTGQGLCGNITVESLAQIPIPQVLTTGATACSASCSKSHAYTYCGMGMPVGPNCNSLLDALVGGCKAPAILCIDVVNPKQPDVPANGTVATLSLGAGNKVPASQSTGDKDAYSSFIQFDGERAHFTSQTCTANTDCQTGLTCQSNVCK